jgi:hypothetical protein
MDLRTVVNIEASRSGITYNDPVMFIGSCFASYVGMQMKSGKMPVLINPSGTVYNPVSVLNTLELITSGRRFTAADLSFHDGLWFSYDHYTDFSSDDQSKVLDRINSSATDAARFLEKAGYLFITFGTARVYTEKASGRIVSNCHRIPASRFSNTLLRPGEIAGMWSSFLDRLRLRFPRLKVIFTISPVRHWKDGPHGNQVSKATLFLAVEELLSHKTGPEYFPAYEIMMDDLRDYRFYDTDMIHPSAQAVEYIWEAFSGCYLDRLTRVTWNEIVKITRAMNHRLSSGDESRKRIFAENMLGQIEAAESRFPYIDFREERSHFKALASGRPGSPDRKNSPG